MRPSISIFYYSPILLPISSRQLTTLNGPSLCLAKHLTTWCWRHVSAEKAAPQCIGHTWVTWCPPGSVSLMWSLYSWMLENSLLQSPHLCSAPLLAPPTSLSWPCLQWDLWTRKVSIDLQFLFLQTGQENCLDLPVSFWTSIVSILLWKSWYISTSLEEIKLLSSNLNYFTR